jgi:hypothetical protein
MLRCKASDMLRNEAYLSVRRRWGFSGSRLGPGKALVRGKCNRYYKPPCFRTEQCEEDNKGPFAI